MLLFRKVLFVVSIPFIKIEVRDPNRKPFDPSAKKFEMNLKFSRVKIVKSAI